MNLPDHRVFGVRKNGSDQSSPSPNHCLTRLFYHGNVTYRYGLDLLVKAFARVHAQRPDARLVIHGRGDYQGALEQLIDELGLREATTFRTELIPLEDLPALIRSAHLAVVPNRFDVFTDGILPTKLMEYAALGMPVVASRSSAIQAYFTEEMVHFVDEESDTALADAILRVIGDERRMRQLSDNIRRFNAMYNWRKESAKYVELVETLADGRATDRAGRSRQGP